ncbi:hypothetical protein QP028_06295 [Corynebacterium suedekumii]|nr:hypothetical protein QP028_06295 [Corynebacterium suedekumii]
MEKRDRHGGAGDEDAGPDATGQARAHAGGDRHGTGGHGGAGHDVDQHRGDGKIKPGDIVQQADQGREPGEEREGAFMDGDIGAQVGVEVAGLGDGQVVPGVPLGQQAGEVIVVGSGDDPQGDDADDGADEEDERGDQPLPRREARGGRRKRRGCSRDDRSQMYPQHHPSHREVRGVVREGRRR